MNKTSKIVPRPNAVSVFGDTEPPQICDVKPKKVQRLKAKRKTRTDGESAYLMAIKELPCGLCGAPAPSDAHHILEGRTPGRKSPDKLAIPLCKNCHQGEIDGIHGQRRMWFVMKKSELDILAETFTQMLIKSKQGEI